MFWGHSPGALGALEASGKQLPGTHEHFLMSVGFLIGLVGNRLALDALIELPGFLGFFGLLRLRFGVLSV